MLQSTLIPWLRMARWYVQPRGRRVERAGERLDRHVIEWAKLADRPCIRPPAVVFTHIPKTGGTTFEAILARNYPPNTVVHINSPVLHRNPAVLFKTGSFPKVVMGHHGLHQVLYRFIDREIAHVTLLRDPIARVVSYFHYLKTSPNHTLHGQVRKLTLREFAAAPLSNELDNGQTMRLAGFQRRGFGSPLIDDDKALSRARDTLERRVTVFGLTEEYPRFLLMCRQLLAWPDVFCLPRNVSGRAPDGESGVDGEVIELISKRNQADIALLEFARDLFDARCSECGIGSAEVESFGRENAQYAELVGERGPKKSETATTRGRRQHTARL